MKRRPEEPNSHKRRNQETLVMLLEDMAKIRHFSTANGLDLKQVVKRVIAFGDQYQLQSGSFHRLKKFNLQDPIGMKQTESYRSCALQWKIKNEPFKFEMFKDIPDHERLLQQFLLNTDLNTMTEVLELEVSVKKLPKFMLKEYQMEIWRRLKIKQVDFLKIEVHQKADELFKILVHVINKNIAEGDKKRKQSTDQTKKYLQSLAKQTGQEVAEALEYADVISNIYDGKIYKQVGGTCYAHAVAEAICSTESRIMGRSQESHEEIAQRIIGKHGDKGGSSQKCLEEYCPPKRIRWSKVDMEKACEAVTRGRVVIMNFYLSKKGWDNFTDFQRQGKSMKNLQQMKNTKEEGAGGHSVAIVGVDMKQQAWIVKNAWGLNQTESKKYRNSIVKIKMNISHLKYLDVYFWQQDLNQHEKFCYRLYLKTRTKDERELEEKKEELMRSSWSYFSRRIKTEAQEMQEKDSFKTHATKTSVDVVPTLQLTFRKCSFFWQAFR